MTETPGDNADLAALRLNQVIEDIDAAAQHILQVTRSTAAANRHWLAEVASVIRKTYSPLGYSDWRPAKHPNDPYWPQVNIDAKKLEANGDIPDAITR